MSSFYFLDVCVSLASVNVQRSAPFYHLSKIVQKNVQYWLKLEIQDERSFNMAADRVPHYVSNTKSPFVHSNTTLDTYGMRASDYQIDPSLGENASDPHHFSQPTTNPNPTPSSSPPPLLPPPPPPSPLPHLQSLPLISLPLSSLPP